jgi:PPE-repeat protein
MVPPQVINTNRAKLASLATTNCLGQSSAAIADTEAEYEMIWADDVDVMYAYARASADASELIPFGPPPSDTEIAGLTSKYARAPKPSWALESALDVLSSGHKVMAAIPKALQGVLSSPQTSLNDYLSSVTASLSLMSSLSERPDTAISNLNCLNRAAVLQKTATLMYSADSSRASGRAIVAGFGRGRTVGTLSVPPDWAPEATIDADIMERPDGWAWQPMHLVHAAGAQSARRPDYSHKSGMNSGD